MNDLTASVVNALATALETALAAALLNVPVRRGEPVQSDGDERQEWITPSIVILPSTETPDQAALGYQIWKEVDPSPDDNDKIRMIWSRGSIDLGLDLWLYTATKTDRAPISVVISSVLNPFRSDKMPADLELTLADHYSAKARVMTLAKQTRDENTAAAGYAAFMWRLNASALVLNHVDVDKTTRLIELS